MTIREIKIIYTLVEFEKERRIRMAACMYVANKNFIMREIAGQTVLVSVGSGVADFCGIINLNETAKELWQALQQPVTIEMLCQTLLSSYDVSYQQALEDVEKTVQMLIDKGMVTSIAE